MLVDNVAEFCWQVEDCKLSWPGRDCWWVWLGDYCGNALSSRFEQLLAVASDVLEHGGEKFQRCGECDV